MAPAGCSARAARWQSTARSSAHGAHTSPGNRAFDASLRRQDPAWGIRNLEDAVLLAAQGGLAFAEAVPMPANNFCAIFEKPRPGAGG